MMPIDPCSDEYWDTPNFCGDCDGTPKGHDPGWSFCPFHGTKLITQAELSDRLAGARAEERISERVDVFEAFRSGEAFGLKGGV